MERPTISRSLPGFFAVACLAASTLLAAGSENSDDKDAFFEAKVRPLLAKHCWKCHGKTKQNGDLRLDSFQSMIDGGESGPAVISGDIKESLLLQAVRYESLEMPPKGKLAQQDIDILQRWVKSGAHWPNQTAIAASKRKSDEVTDEDRTWWSFRPISRPAVPRFENMPNANPIDAFIEAKRRQKKIAHSQRASRRQLIRRVYFDLIGLPPTYEQVKQFELSDDPQAFSKMVNQLLSRPEYGERWGRHWLDIVRFAQTNGYERDDEKPLSWRYRDYVIRSFNEDKPYNQFVREQLAGDQIEPLTDAGLDATGFYRLGVWDDEPDDARKAEFDGLDDIVSTIGTAYLGLTIGCARCHSHKFDPLPQEDYYRMLALVRGIRPYQKPNAKDTSIFRDLPGGGRTLAVREHAKIPMTHILIRGDAGTPSNQVTPGFPRVLFDSTDAASVPSGGSDVSRRTALAVWIASSDNPLTARVIANRVWKHHFGRGIVETPSDFGKTGSRPSHPELLDYLASELIDSGWRIKSLHRLILSSKTWQQSSQINDSVGQQIDPENRLLWRQNARRLEAEAVRDSLLSVSGALNPERGGRGFFPRMPQEVLAGQSRPGIGWDDSDLQQRRRRSVYLFAKRGITDPLLEVFDVASTEQPIASRTSTTVAPQALTLLNSQFVTDQSEEFAKRIASEVDQENDIAVVTRTWEVGLGRRPTDSELQVAVKYLQDQQADFASQPPTIRFRQTVPTSLNTPMWQRRSGAEMLRGPREGWSYSKGRWIDIGDAIHMVQMHQTPAAVYSGLHFDSGTVRGQFRVDGEPHVLSISVGASIQNQILAATEFLIDSVNNQVILQRAGEKPAVAKKAPFVLPANRWVSFELTTTGNKVSLTLDGKRVVHSRIDQPVSGHLAFRLGASLEIAKLEIDSNGQRHRVGIDAPVQTATRLAGWTPFGGQWNALPNGEAQGTTTPYQYALWNKVKVKDGEIRCELKTSARSDAEVLFRVTEPRLGVDTFKGYEVAIHPSRNYLRLGRHDNNFALLKDVPYDFEANRWYSLRIQVKGSRIRVYLGDETEPRIDVTDNSPLPAGQVGIRCAETASWRNLLVRSKGKTQKAGFKSQTTGKGKLKQPSPNHQAISALCNLVYNLNEFVFID